MVVVGAGVTAAAMTSSSLFWVDANLAFRSAFSFSSKETLFANASLLVVNFWICSSIKASISESFGSLAIA